MAIKKLQNNYTTPKQSKRLLKLGVPADSADCYFLSTDGIMIWVRGVSDEHMNWMGSIDKTPIPCWSAVRLMEVFDICYTKTEEEWPRTDEIKEELSCSYIEYLVRTYELAKRKEGLDFSKLEE